MMKDKHSITGEHSWYVESYELPDHDVDTTMRNFPGVEHETFYTMDDIREGDWSGATDTDYNSHEHKDDGKTHDGSRSRNDKNTYTSINDTHGTQGNRFKFKTSSPRLGSNLNKKAIGLKSPLRGSKRKRPS